MTFYFFIKTIRTGKIVHSLLGGVFLGYLSLSWGGFNFTYMILPLVCGIMILLKKYTPNLLIAYVGVEGIGLLIYALYVKFPFTKFFTTIELGGIFYFSIFNLYN